MKKRIHLLSALLAVAMLMTGCGASSSKYESAASAPMAEDMVMEEAAVEEAFEMETAATAGVETNAEISETAQVNRKLIRTFDMQIETKEFDAVLSGIQTKVQELGGYSEQSSLDSGSAFYSSYYRYSNMSVRIPSDKLDGFINEVK